jgi:hypothetical protein
LPTWISLTIAGLAIKKEDAPDQVKVAGWWQDFQFSQLKATRLLF